MATVYPLGLDAFLDPAAVDKVDNANPLLKHSVQHTNINDSMAAVQAQIGVTGSSVATSMEFRLHNVESGHDHDGINSRPVKLGPPTTGSLYLSGVFAFASGTRVGEAIDRINQLLSSSLSGSLTTFQYEGATQGAGGVASVVNFTGNAISASFVGNTVNYVVTRGLIETDRRMILLDGGGPFEGYPAAFRECLMHRKVFPSASIWYTDATKTSRIFEQELIYLGKSIVPTQSIRRVYDVDGTTVLATATDTIFYDGVFEVSRSRVVI